jgi:hypothetical protein
MSAPSKSNAPALVDQALDRRLHRDGFATFPMLTPAEVRRLRSLFGELRGWEGEGFQTDFQTPDPDYRRTVNAELASALEARVTERFTDFQPFLYNFLCKFPGRDGELYLHRDWMYVDERQGHRTYVAWIALEDVRGDNGRLRALRGSHRLDDALRGTDLVAPWLQHERVIGDRLRSLRVSAGTCVVMDNALTHCSYPNLTNDPRLVVAVGMRPREAPLVHFRRADEGTAVRYDVDEDFFCRYTPEDLLKEAPDLPIAETIADNQLHLGADDLATRLDHDVRVNVDRLARRAAGVPNEARGRLHEVVPFRSAGRRGTGSGPTHRALVVTSSPDERRSTAALRSLVGELAQRPGVRRVDTWFLTDPDARAWDGARVVDGPFQTPLLRALGGVRVGGLGRRLRGVRRHVWLLAARPDLIVLDDGLAEPLIRRWSRGHVRVHRANPEPPVHVPPDLHQLVGDADLAVIGSGAAAPVTGRAVIEPELFSATGSAAIDPAEQRRRARRALGLSEDATVVIGVGSDGWVDGPELFVRGLWAIGHRHGEEPDAVWIMRHAAIDELEPLQAEAARCGLAERLRFVTADPDLDLRLAGDIALLPYRDAADGSEALAFLDREVPVVSFGVWGFEHPLLHVVPHLDLDAAADAVVACLTREPRDHSSASVRLVDPVVAWVDRFLDAVAAARS